jgi:hypothetical protein
MHWQSNALKFIPAGTTLSIRFRATEVNGLLPARSSLKKLKSMQHMRPISTGLAKQPSCCEVFENAGHGL